MEVKYKGKNYKVKFQHLRLTDGDQILPNGGRTVAWIELEDESTIEANAECSLKDAYNKKIARTITVGRLLKFPLFEKV